MDRRGRLPSPPDPAQVRPRPRRGRDRPTVRLGAPIIEPAHVPVSAVLGMWRAGESPDVVADEYGLDVEQVRTLVRVA
ncbi:MAG: DUF433 domain-containing protein [Micromonosporaceae bacterium]|nr:DUF433 domain-containing protein [Micromonosporaceae bacterium]